MQIKSTKVIVAPSIDQVLDESSPHEPAILFSTPSKYPDFSFNRRAYQDPELRPIFEPILGLTMEVSKLAFPKHQSVICGIALLIDASMTLHDSKKLDAKDGFDIVKKVAQGSSHLLGDSPEHWSGHAVKQFSNSLTFLAKFQGQDGVQEIKVDDYMMEQLKDVPGAGLFSAAYKLQKAIFVGLEKDPLNSTLGVVSIEELSRSLIEMQSPTWVSTAQAYLNMPNVKNSN